MIVVFISVVVVFVVVVLQRAIVTGTVSSQRSAVRAVAVSVVRTSQERDVTAVVLVISTFRTARVRIQGYKHAETVNTVLRVLPTC